MLEKNNLFKFATKELSQDAFICWCINWINYPNDNKKLYEMAQKIVLKLLDETEYTDKMKIKIVRQYENIDILLLFNELNKIYIIEDKTTSFLKENKNEIQLIRYSEKIKNSLKKINEKYGCNFKFKNIIIKKIFLKTGYWFNQDYKIQEEYKDVKTINRKQILEILKEYKNENIIISDFYEYWEKRTENEEKEKIYFITEEKIKNNFPWGLNISKSSITQDTFLKELFDDDQNKIYNGNNKGGRPWTQLKILSKKFPNVEPEGCYNLFWRVDTHKTGPYLSVNFYLKYENKDIKCENFKKIIDKIVSEIDKKIGMKEKIYKEDFKINSKAKYEFPLLYIELKEYLKSEKEFIKLKSYIAILHKKLKEELSKDFGVLIDK